MNYPDYYDPETGIETYSDIIDYEMEGPAECAIAVLQGYLDRGKNVRIERESDYDGGYYLKIIWEIHLPPEQVAAKARAEEEGRQRRREEAVADELASYLRLKAKYEGNG